ncbi:heme/hemin ABC transporter substrate-binding protein [Bartonella ancashensis]|uniref:Periplasmic hemin-binding protein n=1 Tax=Bartonella ancashensis TaxID=1318743 RepID=A0A0M4LKJ5_9HYPH|nr:ABC transporter substrate-binding protein [Bartonella ancashensis]ALE04014.1 Periplasmic hemin-binding protein [Bartonella ancashensis]
MCTSFLRRYSSVFFACTLFSFIFSLQKAIADFVTDFPENARIVSVGGALTEIIYALGAQDQLIARDSTSTYPEDVLKIPELGYMRALSPEGVLSLSPEGIILVEGSGPPSTIDLLKKTSIPILIVPENFSRENITEKIRFVGKALHKEKQAAVLIQKINDQFIENDALLSKVTQPRRVLFVFSIEDGRALVSGADTAADAMIKLSGAVNAVSDYKGYKLLNNEALLKSQPDVILLTNHIQNKNAFDKLKNNPAIQATPAARNHAIKQIDTMYFLGFGPRTAHASKELIDMLYKTD